MLCLPVLFSKMQNNSENSFPFFLPLIIGDPELTVFISNRLIFKVLVLQITFKQCVYCMPAIV